MTCRIFAGLCAIFIIAGSVFAMPKPTRDFYVNDFAGVLSAAHKNAILSGAKSLSEETGTQIVVVTLETLDGMPIEEYANTLLNRWKIGDRRNNGVLFLIVPSERQTFIEVGYGLEGALTDGTVGQILDKDVLPYFQRGDFSQGIVNGFARIRFAVRGEFTEPLPNSGDRIFLGIFYFVLLFVSIYWLSGGRSMFGWFGGGRGGSGRRSRRASKRGSSGSRGGGGSSGGGGARRRW
jgi:uncharacterized protein